VHIVGNHENRKGGIAWILPPRTGTRYTKDVIRKHGWVIGNCGHHEVRKERLEPHHKLVCNIRNPYTRVQSWWKHLARTHDFTLEDYINNLEVLLDREDPHDVNEAVAFIRRGHPMSYLQSISAMLKYNGISINRINKTVRMETFESDLLELGFKADMPRVYTTAPEKLNINWYNDKPNHVQIINALYADDFYNFKYDMM
jgi:hypothetical protein